MPATTTITSFYTFQINTRPRVGNVNGNFANFRGHLVPIDPNTATCAANFEYGLGAPEYRFATGYLPKIDVSLTSTSALVFQPNTAGEYHFTNNGTSGFYVASDGFYGFNETNFPGNTNGAGLSGLASINVNATHTSTAQDVTAGLLSIVTNGRPVMVGFYPTPSTTGVSYISLYGSTATVSNIFTYVGIKRNGTVIAKSRLMSLWLSVAPVGVRFPPGAITFYDTNAPAGTNTYQLFHSEISTIDGTTLATITTFGIIEFSNVAFFAKEM